MSRIKQIREEEAEGELAELYERVKRKFGRVPNIMQLLGNSPTVLKAYLTLTDLSSETSLSLRVREQIALTVGQFNRCDYCLAAHSAGAKSAGLSEEEVTEARRGESPDPKTREILHFVRSAVENRGWATDAQVQELKAAGVSDKEIAEVVLAISLNMFTNYFNHIVDPEIDFPVAKDLE